MSLTLLPLLQSSQTNIYKKSYGEWVKTGRNGSKFTIKKNVISTQWILSPYFQWKVLCLYQTFLDLQLCYYKKGSPVRFLINSGSCWRKPTAKIRCFASINCVGGIKQGMVKLAKHCHHTTWKQNVTKKEG